MNRIVVVTGSRDWRYPAFVSLTLNAIYARSGPFHLYHGDCRDKDDNPCGADYHADLWARSETGMIIKRHPADWSRYGNAAGPIRNGEMTFDAYTAVGGDLSMIQLVAYKRRPISKGTDNCIKEAKKLGIYTTTWTEADVPTYMKPEPPKTRKGI